MPRFKVTFVARFEGYVDADSEEEAMTEAHIPESDSTKYVSQSYEVRKVEQVPRPKRRPLKWWEAM